MPGLIPGAAWMLAWSAWAVLRGRTTTCAAARGLFDRHPAVGAAVTAFLLAHVLKPRRWVSGRT